jgi:hypothetical protein
MTPRRQARLGCERQRCDLDTIVLSDTVQDVGAAEQRSDHHLDRGRALIGTAASRRLVDDELVPTSVCASAGMGRTRGAYCYRHDGLLVNRHRPFPPATLPYLGRLGLDFGEPRHRQPIRDSAIGADATRYQIGEQQLSEIDRHPPQHRIALVDQVENRPDN